MLAVFNKLKEMLWGKDHHTGAISVTFVDFSKGKIFTQEIWGIRVYRDKSKMLDYLHGTIMTTKPSNIGILDYAELNK